jgi:hypothetical protein
MTYNFDPDRWYDNEYMALAHQFKTGKMDRETYQKALAELEKRYDDMVKRLDGTYQIPE